MSKKWYPVIDYVECIECGSCIDKCKHGVYDQKKASTPVVVLPESCIQGCHGCGNLCPVDAISYVREKTKEDDNCICGCSCGESNGGCC